MDGSPYRKTALFGVALSAVGLTGCVSLGPRTIARDRFEYSASITESWKRQTLLNIVKLRYADPPIFVDVGQIVAGYSLETAVSAGGQLSSPGAVQGDSITLGGAGRFTDRPTITYTPLTGNRFVQGLMTPMRPSSVFFTIEAGWPADAILFASLSSLNGMHNQSVGLAGFTPAEPGFLRALELLRKIQQSGGVGLRVVPGGEAPETTIVTLRSAAITEDTLNDIRALRQLLGLDPDASEFRLVFGSVPSSNREVAVVTRSVMQILTTMAAHVSVPEEHVREGRAAPGRESLAGTAVDPRLIDIHSSTEEPPDAHVAVPYRDRWFWIDDRDLKSKRSLSFMMLLFTLADTGEPESLPLITIPAQ